MAKNKLEGVSITGNSDELEALMSGALPTRTEKPQKSQTQQPVKLVANDAQVDDADVHFGILIPESVKIAVAKRAAEERLSLRAFTLKAFKAAGIDEINDSMLRRKRKNA